MCKKPRDERKEIFEDTRQIYGMDRRLMDSVSFSKYNQRVIAEEVEVTAPEDRYDAPAKVLVSQKRRLRKYSRR